MSSSRSTSADVAELEQSPSAGTRARARPARGRRPARASSSSSSTISSRCCGGLGVATIRNMLAGERRGERPVVTEAARDRRSPRGVSGAASPCGSCQYELLAEATRAARPASRCPRRPAPRATPRSAPTICLVEPARPPTGR